MIRSIEEQIDSAIDALTNAAAPAADIREGFDEGDGTLMSDTDILSYPTWEDATFDSTSVYVEIDELSQLVEALHRRGIERANLDRRDRIMSHERDHAALLALFRPQRIGQRAELERAAGEVTVRSYEVMPYGFEIPVLGSLAALAYPLHGRLRARQGPSKGDLRAMVSLGCRGGVQEVGRRIEAWNEAGRRPQLWLPQTYIRP
ncbi:MAG TPA: hypothetical protein VLE99_02145 [Candidatus Saccharimonadales bacterium]|nr:hypothetical protein [Candidatus Saccharimonadales bacterium]